MSVAARVGTRNSMCDGQRGGFLDSVGIRISRATE